jgi:hypothetical protein
MKAPLDTRERVGHWEAHGNREGAAIGARESGDLHRAEIEAQPSRKGDP